MAELSLERRIEPWTSPTSRTHDRITKPAQYAAGGVPAYWRVETVPEVSLTAYVLTPGEGPSRGWDGVEGETARLAHPIDLGSRSATWRPELARGSGREAATQTSRYTDQPLHGPADGMGGTAR